MYRSVNKKDCCTGFFKYLSVSRQEEVAASINLNTAALGQEPAVTHCLILSLSQTKQPLQILSKPGCEGRFTDIKNLVDTLFFVRQWTREYEKLWKSAISLYNPLLQILFYIPTNISFFYLSLCDVNRGILVSWCYQSLAASCVIPLLYSYKPVQHQ